MFKAYIISRMWRFPESHVLSFRHDECPWCQGPQLPQIFRYNWTKAWSTRQVAKNMRYDKEVNLREITRNHIYYCVRQDSC